MEGHVWMESALSLAFAWLDLWDIIVRQVRLTDLIDHVLQQNQ